MKKGYRDHEGKQKLALLRKKQRETAIYAHLESVKALNDAIGALQKAVDELESTPSWDAYHNRVEKATYAFKMSEDVSLELSSVQQKEVVRLYLINLPVVQDFSQWLEEKVMCESLSEIESSELYAHAISV